MKSILQNNNMECFKLWNRRKRPFFSLDMVVTVYNLHSFCVFLVNAVHRILRTLVLLTVCFLDCLFTQFYILQDYLHN